jgi:hypothetical protein
MNEKIHDEDEQCCLEDIVHSNRVIRFYADCPDKEFPGITWSCYGAIDTGEVIVRGKKGLLEYYHSAPSPVIWPPMADRRFGIDARDDELAHQLGDELWREVGVHLCLHKS